MPMSFLGDLGLAGVNAGLSLVGNAISNKNARDNFDYQMDRYYSPQAQVRNLAAAGINPAVAFGNQSPVFSGGGSMAMPTNPLAGIGTTSLSDLASYINAKSNAKKAGAETRNLDIDAQAKQFDLELAKIFKAPSEFAALTLAWKNVRLSDDEHNIKEWTKEKEKALAQTQGVQRDTLQKVLDNMDIQIQQENKQREEDIKLTQEKQKTEKTSQSANVASANASNAAASVSRENRRLQAALADIEEAGKTDKINSLISEYKSKGLLSDADAKDAQIRLDRLSSVEDKRTTKFFREVDNYLEWLKNKVSIFKTK